MQRRTAKRLVTFGSLVIAVASFAALVVFRAMGRSEPTVVIVGLTYGMVFWLIYLLDEVGRQAAGFRSGQDRVRSARPRPVPVRERVQAAEGVESGNRLQPREDSGVPMQPREPDSPLDAATVAPVPPVRLVPVREEESASLQTMLDAAFTEVFALDDKRPVKDAQGHVAQASAKAWQNAHEVRVFWISDGRDALGCCAFAIEDQPSLARLLTFYVVSPWRRQTVGRQAMARLAEFTAMLGVNQLQVTLSQSNLRARRFVKVCGFEPSSVAEVGPSSDEGVQPSADNSTTFTLALHRTVTRQ